MYKILSQPFHLRDMKEVPKRNEMQSETADFIRCCHLANWRKHASPLTPAYSFLCMNHNTLHRCRGRTKHDVIHKTGST